MKDYEVKDRQKDLEKCQKSTKEKVPSRYISI